MAPYQKPKTEYDNLASLLDLVKDEGRFQERVTELNNKIKESERILQQARDKSHAAEENKKLTAQMLDEANRKLQTAQEHIAQADQMGEDLRRSKQRLSDERKNLEVTRAGFEKQRDDVAHDFRNREEKIDRLIKDLAAREEAFAADCVKRTQEAVDLIQQAKNEAVVIKDFAHHIRLEADAHKAEATVKMNDVIGLRRKCNEFFKDLLGE